MASVVAALQASGACVGSSGWGKAGKMCLILLDWGARREAVVDAVASEDAARCVPLVAEQLPATETPDAPAAKTIPADDAHVSSALNSELDHEQHETPTSQ